MTSAVRVRFSITRPRPLRLTSSPSSPSLTPAMLRVKFTEVLPSATVGTAAVPGIVSKMRA